MLAADASDAAGLTVPPLAAAARGELAALGLGAGSSLANPLEIPVGPGGRTELVGDAVRAIWAHHRYADVIVHLNVLSFFTFGSSAESLLAYAGAVADLRRPLAGTRITLVLRNADCAPPGVAEQARSIARSAGVPVYHSIESAAVAVAAGQRFAR